MRVHLNVEQVQLDRVPGVHVLVGIKELASEQQGFALLHSLLPERPAVVQPVHCQSIDTVCYHSRLQRIDVHSAQTSPAVDIDGEVSQAARNVNKPTRELRLTVCRVVRGGGDSLDGTQTVISMLTS